jgi:hypothetical protein
MKRHHLDIENTEANKSQRVSDASALEEALKIMLEESMLPLQLPTPRI